MFRFDHFASTAHIYCNLARVISRLSKKREINLEYPDVSQCMAHGSKKNKETKQQKKEEIYRTTVANRAFVHF